MNIPAEFSKNQLDYFRRSLSAWLNVAEGGKRGGKNVLNCISFCTRLEKHPERLHLVAGVSVAAAKLNIIDCDGYGIKNYFAGRCREGIYKNRECLYVDTATGEKVILISGGGKNGDEKLIKGNTYGTAYITEANECSELFVNEVFDRTLSSVDRCIFHDLNPKGAGHWYYKRILEFHEARQSEDSEYGYNYGHFTIADNFSISDTQLKKIIGTYDRRSVWFQRDILGLRKTPEGVIYDMATAENFYNEEQKPPFFGYERFIAIDYGTTNPCIFLDVYDGDGVVYVDNEYRWDSRTERGQKTDAQYAEELERFIGGNRRCEVIVDPSAASFIAELRNRDLFVVPAKNEVIGGIRKVSSLLAKNKIKINRRCVGLIEELGLYAWDERAARNGEEKPIKEHDHALDALRYYVNSLPMWRIYN